MDTKNILAALRAERDRIGKAIEALEAFEWGQSEGTEEPCAEEDRKTSPQEKALKSGCKETFIYDDEKTLGGAEAESIGERPPIRKMGGPPTGNPPQLSL